MSIVGFFPIQSDLVDFCWSEIELASPYITLYWNNMVTYFQGR